MRLFRLKTIYSVICFTFDHHFWNIPYYLTPHNTMHTRKHKLMRFTYIGVLPRLDINCRIISSGRDKGCVPTPTAWVKERDPLNRESGYLGSAQTPAVDHQSVPHTSETGITIIGRTWEDV